MLSGSLEEFALSDIFRLIAGARKTGRLEITRKAGSGGVYFRDGEIYFAESNLRREPLGQKLIRAGVLTERDLMKALDEHASTGMRVGEVLVRNGAIDKAQLAIAIQSQVQDAASDCLKWEVGDFEFESSSEVVAEIPIRVDVDFVIMEASRLIDDIDGTTRKLRSVSLVLRRVADISEAKQTLRLTSDEERIFFTVDGQRTVAEVVTEAKDDELTVLRTLHGLLSAGALDFVPTASKEREPLVVQVVEPASQEIQIDEIQVAEEVPIASVEPEPTQVTEPAVEQVAEPVAEIDLESATEEPIDIEVPEAVAYSVPVVEAPVESPIEAPIEARTETPQFQIPQAQAPQFQIPDPDVPAAETLGDADAEAAVLDLLGEAPADDREVVEAIGVVEVPEAPAPAPEPVPEVVGEWFKDPDLAAANGAVETFDETPPPAPDPPSAGPEPAPPSPAVQEAPAPAPTKVDRAVVVRELASLFSDDDPHANQGSGDQVGTSGAPRRIEDDDDIDRGLIHRLIDGVKGL